MFARAQLARRVASATNYRLASLLARHLRHQTPYQLKYSRERRDIIAAAAASISIISSIAAWHVL